MASENWLELREIALKALHEDGVHEDLTTLCCIDPESRSTAQLLLKEPALIAGLPFLPFIFNHLDPTSTTTLHALEGGKTKEAFVIATVIGKTRALLSGERAALNLLQLATSIATKTSRFVEAVSPLNCHILDTRKTIPNLRALQRYAVTLGGGKNHRLNLSKAILIKDNHLKALEREGSSPIGESISRARKLYPGVSIEVEVESIEEFKEALRHNPDSILLDNMTPDMIRACVALSDGKIYLEASGGISLSSARAYAETGVNGISIGALTHSIEAIDLSINII